MKGTRGVLVVEDEDVRDGGAGGRGAAALEHVANRPIADHVLDDLESAGVEEVVVASSHARAAEIRNAVAHCGSERGMRVSFVAQDGPLELSSALRLVAPLVGAAPCLVHLASGLLGEPLRPLVSRLQDGSPDVVLIVHHQPAPNERLNTATQDMLNIAALHPEQAALGMAGVWLFGPRALQHVGNASWRTDGEVDLTSIAERIAGANGSVHVRVAEDWHNYSGDPLKLLELNQIALDRLIVDNPRANANGHSRDGNRIEGRVRIHETASVRSSVIVGPTIIGADATITDAYIGPYTSIGPRAHIEGAEIERSIVLSGASVMHIGGRLVASVVGREARIFRDFSLPRAFRLRVGDRTEVALC